MKQTICLLILVLFALCSEVTMAQSPASIIRSSDLKNQPFNVDGLVITIKKLDGHVRMSYDERDLRVGYVMVHLENGMSKPITFQPSRLVIVGKDSMQASVAYQRRRNGSFNPAKTDRVQATEITIAPNAKIELEYTLSERIRFPAKLYYGEKLLVDLAN